MNSHKNTSERVWLSYIEFFSSSNKYENENTYRRRNSRRARFAGRDIPQFTERQNGASAPNRVSDRTGWTLNCVPGAPFDVPWDMDPGLPIERAYCYVCGTHN